MDNIQETSSIFRVGENCMQTTCSDRATFLVDGEAYFQAFMKSTERARHSIIILAWDFNSRTNLSPQKHVNCPALLSDFLNFIVGRRPSLHVYILDWDYPMIFGVEREFSPRYGLNWLPHRRVHFEYDNTHPVGASHHQKLVVIDDAVAFSGGMDLTCGRWDTRRHKTHEPCRCTDGIAYPPFHDAMTMVDGETARALGTLARARWKRATGKTIPSSTSNSDPWPEEIKPDLRKVKTAVSRTMPVTDQQDEIREVEKLYLDMIGSAKQYIYIENQYFTSHKIAGALAKRLSERAGPEIVIVLRLLSHGWLEELTMHVLRSKLVTQLKQADRWERLGVYYPYIEGLNSGTCIDVHSKLCIIDDRWLRIGSANISNRSMGFDSECDITFEAIDQNDHAIAIREFRDRLLAEHLNSTPQNVSAEYQANRSLNRTVALLSGQTRGLRKLVVEEASPIMLNAASIADPETPISLDKLALEFSPVLPAKNAGIPWRMLTCVIVTLLALAGFWHFAPVAETLSPAHVAALAREVGSRWWTPLLIILTYTPATLVLFPRPLITLFAVISLGTWAGALCALSGVLVAALVTYFVGRNLSRATLRNIGGNRLNHVAKILRKKGLLAVIALRIVPVAPFAIIGLVAGAVRIKASDYTLGSLIGFMPGTIATVILGDQLNTAAQNPADINYILIVGAAALIVGIFVVRYFVFDGAFFKPSGLKTSTPQTTGSKE